MMAALFRNEEILTWAQDTTQADVGQILDYATDLLQDLWHVI